MSILNRPTHGMFEFKTFDLKVAKVVVSRKKIVLFAIGIVDFSDRKFLVLHKTRMILLREKPFCSSCVFL